MDAHDIYFFLQSPSRCQSQLELEHWQKHTTSYWSTDPTGQSQLTESQCKEMGLPVAAHVVSQIEIRYTLTSCSPEICAAVDAWQLAQGFDPTTADFAGHLGYPEFELKMRLGATESNAYTVENTDNVSDRQEPQGQDAMDMEAQHFLRLSSPSVTARPRPQAAIKASARMKSVDPCSSQQGKQRVGRKRKSSEGCGTERGRQTIKRRKIH
ncbi:hypothetical protein VNI00_003634 [Paramarasmius palmivorus]|uniref:Uncharacterized protein n=1 Tax=Paramarasmius palmivorus TaxID=297713 RepID=A0AAW0DTN5_9AGAR